MHTEARGNFVYRLSAAMAVVFSVALVALIIAEIYVRWTLNQDFSFLGSTGVLGLSILVLGLTLGLIYSQKQ